MDFDLSDEQRLLKDSVDRLIDDHYGDFARRQAYAREPHGFSARMWATYAELGLLGLPFAEEQGGSGGGPVETMIVMEAFGRGLALEPYLASVILGGGLLRAAGHAALVPAIVDGSARLAFAHVERQARYDLHDIATTARREGGAWVIEGDKGVVLHGDSATHLAVAARTGGGRREAGGISLFLIDAGAEGVSRRGYPTQDGMRAAEISLARVRVPDSAMLGPAGGAAPLIDSVVDAAVAALCAEAVGAMAALQVLTVDYLKQRRQFGTAIGGFQVLQHRAVDMLVAVEQARSMAIYAAMMAGDPDPAARRAAIASAKVQVNRSARLVGQEAIQLHGGIGMTMEYKAGHYFKRLAMIETLFGDTEHHLRTVAQAV
jgi:pimeloyl-CoA dehydrogenase small subunit